MRRYSNTAKSVCVLSVFLLLFGYVAVDVCQAQELCKKLIATGNPEYPPFLWRDAQDENHLAGANADLMQAISKEIGVPIEVKYVGPWARVQEEARLGRVDLIAGAFYTPPRLDYMDYFYPAFRETRTAIWTKKNSKLIFRKWSDLRGKNGITVINNSFGDVKFITRRVSYLRRRSGSGLCCQDEHERSKNDVYGCCQRKSIPDDVLQVTLQYTGNAGTHF